MSENDRGIAKERKRFIKQSEQYLTSFERFSHNMLSIMYKGILWVLLPFIILIFLVDGFNLSVLVFVGIIFFVFVPIMRQNEKRLEILIKSRMEMEKKTVLEQPIEPRPKMEPSNANEAEVSFAFPGISINMGANSFFVTAISFFITFLFVWSHGWGNSLTKFFLYLSIALLVFSFWFPYSNFVRRQVKSEGDFLKIGKRTLFYREFREVHCRGNGSELEFHLTYTAEPIKIRPENDFQQEAKGYIKEWCEHFEIPFTEMPK